MGKDIVTIVGRIALTFYASFDHWLAAEVAPGGRIPVKQVGGALGPGRNGQGLLLDGNSYVEYPGGRNIGAGAATVAFWFRPEAWGGKTYDTVFGLSDTDTNALNFERSHPDGRLRIVVGGPQSKSGQDTRSLYSREPLRDGQWVHLAVGWDPERQLVELWVDGRLHDSLAGPGPLPISPPCILAGCGWGRMQRAVKGTLDDLVILDHAVAGEELAHLMQGLGQAQGRVVEIGNEALVVSVDEAAGEVSLGSLRSPTPEVLIGPGTPAVQVEGKAWTWRRWEAGDEFAERGGAMGKGAHRVFSSPANESGLSLRYHVQVFEKEPLALAWMEVTNRSDRPVTAERLTVMPEFAHFGRPGGRSRVFLDNGGLMGSGSLALNTPDARHTAHGALVVTEPEKGWAVSASFVTFQTASVTNQVETGRDGTTERLAAYCDYPNGYALPPGETLSSEVFAVGVYDDPHRALERWADTVMAVNGFAAPRFCPSGWNSWYCYRLTVTEEIVLQHARFIKERWDGLGLENIQIDHGWQYRDVIGNWVPNERFPHGLPWLSERLQEMGFSLGLWTAVTGVSEFAPLYREHSEALIRGDDGNPLVTGEHWYWAPHGKTYTLDPTSATGLDAFRRWGEALRAYGCAYNKNDFQGDLLTRKGRLTDPVLTRGAPVYRKGMGAFAAGKGPEMAYHACNAPLNVVAGLADVAWVHGDIGNPGGNWEWLQKFVRDFSSRYHVSGKFYWSDPDYLQVGQGTLQEARVRMVICALGGGPAFLSDRLPELTEERLALIPRCLPSYRRTATPVDLFERDDYPRLWDLPVKTAWGQWHVLGAFNLDERPGSVTVNLSRLGLEAGREYLVYDFFGEKLIGKAEGLEGADLLLKVAIPATDVRLLKVVAREARPSVMSTDMHLTQGGVELPEVAWDDGTATLSGVAARAAGMSGRIFVYVPKGYEAPGMEGRMLTVPVTFRERLCRWTVAFRRV